MDNSQILREEVNKAYLAQLAQLNERARTYTSRIWQVPFAYIGVVAIALNALVNQDSNLLLNPTILLLATTILGALIRLHMWGNREGAARAVHGIREVESKLGLDMDPSAEYRWWAHLPLELMVSGVAGGCGAMAALQKGWNWLFFIVPIGILEIGFLILALTLLAPNQKANNS